MKKIVLAGGCFWGVEEYISRIKGVVKTNVGYANGITKNPSYKEVCTGMTGYAEAVYVEYDENQISLKELLNKYWEIVEPTVLNRQGPDIGHQYRTGIYFIDTEDKNLIIESRNEEQKKYDSQIVTEVEKLECYYVAEEYHQKYLKKNPEGYCHINLN
ncbi:peptide-methionine (S)-S-oxide reductase [Clostridium cavendishii DSM 21758]|uniref:Peptide methionine sulfoxide reductase MsrA n=1 Tax=Clostridium cavendishii DSM 21758 TaxID=1121302 RepID=A0A1M6B823_9CLOT|nr:peptide-methionine (S)-S-oxide reductase MsrA [Clostridium cavendishii]SHI44876.1 peptide-methionine (S)-S-oxide reductase [Clostridium cavendishii DSM 21758]